MRVLLLWLCSLSTLVLRSTHVVVYISSLFFLKKYFVLIMLLQLSHFSPFIPLCPAHPPPTCIPPLQFMSMGHTYKLFGFYISYTILTLPLSIFYLPFMLLTLCTFSPLSPPPTPLLITLNVISISVVLFLFQLFAYVFVLGVVVNNCEFAVILLFISFIFFFLDKSL